MRLVLTLGVTRSHGAHDVDPVRPDFYRPSCFLSLFLPLFLSPSLADSFHSVVLPHRRYCRSQPLHGHPRRCRLCSFLRPVWSRCVLLYLPELARIWLTFLRQKRTSSTPVRCLPTGVRDFGLSARKLRASSLTCVAFASVLAYLRFPLSPLSLIKLYLARRFPTSTAPRSLSSTRTCSRASSMSPRASS